MDSGAGLHHLKVSTGPCLQAFTHVYLHRQSKGREGTLPNHTGKHFLSGVWEAVAAGGAAGSPDVSAQPGPSLQETLGPMAASFKMFSCSSCSVTLLCLAAEPPSLAFIQGVATDTHQPKPKIHSLPLTLFPLPAPPLLLALRATGASSGHTRASPCLQLVGLLLSSVFS